VGGEHIPYSFGYTIEEPIVHGTDISWMNQLNILDLGRIRVNLNLCSGLFYTRLEDKAVITHVYTTTTVSHGTSTTNTSYTYKILASNYYFGLEPGLDIEYKLGKRNKKPPGDGGYLFAQVKYNYLMGISTFGTTDQFSGYLATVGLSILIRNKSIPPNKR